MGVRGLGFSDRSSLMSRKVRTTLIDPRMARRKTGVRSPASSAMNPPIAGPKMEPNRKDP